MNRTKIQQMLINEEGFELKPYHCTAEPPRLTIGVGRNLDDRGISEATAYQMLNEDIDICIAELELHLPNFNNYPEDVKHTLIDLCFNMGISRLLQFKQTLKYIDEGLQSGNYTKAAVELLNSNYAKQLPARSKRNHDRLFNA